MITILKKLLRTDSPYKRIHRGHKPSNVGYELLTRNNGTKIWLLNGYWHREDGPAVHNSNGDKFWSLKGKYHRIGGPAVEYHLGIKEWWQNGELHREDGPAVKGRGVQRWFLNNTEVTEEKFNEVWNCPLDRLPLYINTPLAPIVRRRLSHGA